MPTVDGRQSTTRSSIDPGQHATTGSSGGVSDGSSRKTPTASALDNSVSHMTKVSNAGGDGSVPDHTTSTPNASDSERSTTTYETSLKNVKLNLSVDFDLADLNEEEKKNLESISKAYGLD
ncbi:hypothetical protein AAVH_41865, partial [Aphelenchoides avenae]